MKVLYVVSGNKKKLSPFFLAQYNSLKPYLAKTNVYSIKGNGILGYLKNLSALRRKIKDFKPDLIHAHYGFSGLLACLQRKIPVIITFHGSDINQRKNILWSIIASKLSFANIYVHPDLPNKVLDYNLNLDIIPCGVDTEKFYQLDKIDCRRKLKLNLNKKYILFSSSFNNPVKNYTLAKQAIKLLDNSDVELIELKGYSVEQVNLLMNAVDLLLVTSFSETGPLVVKEAMACNKPIVATDVGDIKFLFGEFDGYYLTSYDPNDVKSKIESALEFSDKYTNGRKRIIELGYDTKTIAKKIYEVYKMRKLTE